MIFSPYSALMISSNRRDRRAQKAAAPRDVVARSEVADTCC
jgi:hypothetical protein